MKISYNWLKEYIKIDIEPEKLSQIITDIGLEVEGYEKFQTIKGGLEGIVVGKVLTCDKHPNADKLSITTVNVGNNIILPIVCGAPNVAAGQTVLVATEGTKLYDGDKEFEIKQTKIRGEVSQGMICAEDEIGLGTSHEGIMVLPAEIEAGTLAKTYFNIQDDYVFEIGLTPNRIDAASHYGVARDIAAFLSLSGTCTLQKPSVADFTVQNNSLPVQVIVDNVELCPRYAGVVIENVNIAESPAWLKNRLAAIGQKSINNIVDITNFILHEFAQPLHAFDLSKIEGNEVRVRTVANKTKFITLDGVERELSDEDLMICNSKKPMCIAGVFGGIESGVTDQTTSIFLESAYFNPVSIRKTARRHGLSTDASFRFERGIDPNNTVYALKRAAVLIQQIAGGKISNVFDSNPVEVAPKEIQLQVSKIQKLIGKQVEKEIIVKILSSLEIQIKSDSQDNLTVLVPAYRVDVLRQEDIVEDILRIYGYNNVEIPTAVKSSIVYGDKVNDTKLKNSIADMLVATGLSEIMNNSLTRSQYYNSDTLVKILNPLSTELDILRNSMMFGCLEVVSYNCNRQMSDVAVFEFGRTYAKIAEMGTVTEKYNETQILAISLYGKQAPQYWAEQQNETDIYVLKSLIQKIGVKLGFEFKFSFISNDEIMGLEILNRNKKVGVLGIVSKKISKKFDLEKPCLYSELLWDELLHMYKMDISYKELPQYPEVRRDLSLLLDTKIQFESIKKIALETEKKLIKEVSIFDVYQGKGIPEGKKSYAVSFILQDMHKTLTDTQIEGVMNKLIQAFKKELQAELR